MRVTFHPAARTEYLAAAEYYESCREGLGARFTFEVEAALARVLEAPSRWPIIEQDVRRCLTHTFPYGILYTIEQDSLLILAITHCSRKPGYWQERLRSESPPSARG